MRNLSNFDPYNIVQLLSVTAEQISKMEECTIPRKIYFAAAEYLKEAPEHEKDILLQLLRNSSSIGLNFQEAWGKGKGYFVANIGVSSGSANECYESLQYIPELHYLLPDALELCELIREWFIQSEKKRIEFEEKKHWKK
jgi:four helix bundle protein